MRRDEDLGRLAAGGIIEAPERMLAGRGLLPGTPLVIERTDDGVLLLPVLPDAKRIYVEPTTRCNLACTTCIRHSWDEKPVDLDYALFAGLVAQLRSFPNLESAHFAGFGEPLLHPRIFDMLDAMHEAGVGTEMTTNGLMLDDSAARRLMDVGLGTLIVSVDGVEPATYGVVRPGADLPQVLHNLRRVARIRDEAGRPRPRLGVEFVAMRSNCQEIADLLRLATEMRLDYVVISNLLPYSQKMAGEILYGDGNFDLPVSPWYHWHWGMERLRLPQMRLRTERLCRFVDRAAFAVTADGMVSPCYSMMHSHTEHVLGRRKRVERWAAGDLRERSLLDIWTAPEYVRFRSRVRRFDFPSCPDCQSVDGCYFSQSNAEDCWMNTPSCADCLWSRGMIVCF